MGCGRGRRAVRLARSLTSTRMRPRVAQAVQGQGSGRGGAVRPDRAATAEGTIQTKFTQTTRRRETSDVARPSNKQARDKKNGDLCGHARTGPLTQAGRFRAKHTLVYLG